MGLPVPRMGSSRRDLVFIALGFGSLGVRPSFFGSSGLPIRLSFLFAESPSISLHDALGLAPSDPKSPGARRPRRACRSSAGR